jgi:choline-sulfatase
MVLFSLMNITKSNILILMADQLSPGFLPAYGNEQVQAPTIERLAREGVVFDSAYCASPLCAPSRYAFMTGQLPSTIGAFDNACPLASAVPTFAHYLRDAGYRTILSGKMHFCGAEQLHGFEERLTTDIYPADFGWTPDWLQPEQRQEWYHNMRSVTQAGQCVRTNQLDFDDEVVFTTRQKLYDLAREPDTRPFCLVASLTHPHDPYAIPAAYWDRYQDDAIAPVRVSQAEVDDDPHSRRIRAMCMADGVAVTAEQTLRARQAYFGAISYVDDQFAAILQVLAETGQAQDTIVIVVSDHGEMLGERGLWYKMTFFEGAARVPLIVHAPGRFPAHRVSASVSLVDLLPTLVELAGITPLQGEALAGQSLLPHLHNQPGHDQAIAEYLAEGALAPLVMIRRGDYKFVHSPTDPDQLYDLAHDPDERVNLAQHHDYLPLREAFLAEVAARWDLPGLKERVVQSQRRRALVYRALQQGGRSSFDYQPLQDASRRYIRNHLKLDDLEAMARFPAV